MRVAIPVIKAPGLAGGDGIFGVQMNDDWVDGDEVNGHYFDPGERRILLAHNTNGGSAHNVTILGVADSKLGRDADYALTVPSNEPAIFGPIHGGVVHGFRQPAGANPEDGKVWVDVAGTGGAVKLLLVDLA